MGHTRLKLTRRGFLKLAVRSTIAVAGTSLGSLTWAREVEPNWVEVKHLPLVLPRLAPAFHGFRLAHISDIHMDVWMTRRRLTQAVQLINSQQPDLVAITGDFVTYTPEKVAPGLVAALSQLKSRHGTVAVLGNHDHWTDASIVRHALKQASVLELNNAAHTLRRGGDVLHIAGLDDAWAHKARMDLLLSQLPEHGAAILLAHEPDFADTYTKTRRFDLQLSGHSHGGQVRVPLSGPIRLPPYGKKYHSGLYDVEGMALYTNRGLGMLQPYVRFNCRPEITIFHLQAIAS